MSVPDIYTNTFCIFADGQIPFSKTDAACTGSPMLIMISTGGGHARLSKYRFTEAVIMPACVNRREKKSARGPKPVGWAQSPAAASPLPSKKIYHYQFAGRQQRSTVVNVRRLSMEIRAQAAYPP